MAALKDWMTAFSSITYSSPTRRAVVRMLATSDPAPGSVMPSAAMRSPASAGFKNSSICAGVPSPLIASFAPAEASPQAMASTCRHGTGRASPDSAGIAGTAGSALIGAIQIVGAQFGVVLRHAAE